MKKTVLTFASMLVLGVGVSMAQSAEATTETAPKTEKHCSKKGKKACCKAKAGADASAKTEDSKGTSAATEVKPAKAVMDSRSSTTLPVK